LVNICGNPNVYGTIVIGIGQKAAEDLSEAISKGGRPVEVYDIESSGGSIKTTEAATRRAMQMASDASRVKRANMPLSELVLGVECGTSDGTSGIASNPAAGLVADRIVDRGGSIIMSETAEILGAEHLLAGRAANSSVKEKLLNAANTCMDYTQEMGIDLLGVNPIPENIRGGISTIEEKALGAIKKGGSTPIVEVIRNGDRPTRKGLIFMDAPAPAIENMTALCAGGAQVIVFTTGKGHTCGNAICPTIKVCGNPTTVKLVRDNIDVDLSEVIAGNMSIEAASEILERELIDVCIGKVTRAEILGEEEMAISRVCKSV
jgi:altronate dehydratase large subunit